MGEFMRVEIGTLQQYVSTLRTAQRELAELPKLLNGDDTAIGNDRLDDAAWEFQRNWGYGAKQLGELVDETSDAVTDVLAGYRSADQKVADAIGSMLQPLQSYGQFGDALIKRAAAGH